jgi:hypothetical protein
MPQITARSIGMVSNKLSRSVSPHLMTELTYNAIENGNIDFHLLKPRLQELKDQLRCKVYVYLNVDSIVLVNS